MPEAFSENLKRLQERMSVACRKAGRATEAVNLLPVTKTQPLQALLEVWRAGLPAVGENRVQEALDKIGDPRCPEGLRWELIGHLQSNKAREAARNFWRVQSVDSPKLLQRLDRFAGENGKTLRILLQVNAGRDPAKYGVSCEETPDLLEVALGCHHLQVDGLMTIAPLAEDPEVARACFRRLRETRDRLVETMGHPLPELSMGMTDDLEAAIAEGSTQIRVGRALFGERQTGLDS